MEPEKTGDFFKLSSIILCVFSVVLVIPHLIWGTSILEVKYENGIGSSSADCNSIKFQSIVFFTNLGGVPVLRRPTGNPRFLIFWESLEDDLSPKRPASNVSLPTNIFPPRNVPVVITNELQKNFLSLFKINRNN